jgi:aerobic carbon-monoxide dehydrogenase medium subunit
VKPPPFEYVAARSLDEAVAALDDEDAKPIAGGQSLVPALNMRLVRPSRLVDLRHAGLDTVARDNGSVRIGAMVRQADLRGLATDLPLVALALPFIGHVATRNRGTVGGSIAHADGAAELPLCLAVLDGVVVAESRPGRREIAAADFFVTHFFTTLEPGELVVETVWPLARDGEASGFEELALRTGDFAQSMAAVVLRREGEIVAEARVGVGAVTDRPTRLPDVEALLVGSSGHDAAADAGALAARLVDPPSTTHASSGYLRSLTGTLVRRAIERAR